MSASFSCATKPAITTGFRPPASRAATISVTLREYPGRLSRSGSLSTSRSTATGPCEVCLSRSVSVTRPRISPSRTTGRWWTLASRSTVQASCTGIEPSTVLTGRERTRATGVSGPSPWARTRTRKSRSVTMPGVSPRTMTDETRCSTMVRAASPTVAVSSTQTAARRTRVSTGAARSTRKVATGECSRLDSRRVARPAVKWAAKRASESSRWNSSPGIR